MKIVNLDQNTDEWLEFRKGKITGSKLKDVITERGSGKKDGFYELIADRLSLPEESDEQAHDRGHRLENEALELFEFNTGKVVDKDCGMWLSDEDENIAISPDGGIKDKKGVYAEACEVKCLSGKHHIRAIVENSIGNGFKKQVIQYFIVNTDLKKLHFIFYDPRIAVRPLHVIEFTRVELAAEIDLYLQWERDILKEVNQIIESLAF